MLMYIPEGGTLKMYEIYPSGMAQGHVLGFPESGYHCIWFCGDVPGEHITIFTVDDVSSNVVMIEVLLGYESTPPYLNAIESLPENPEK
jgi:hypothetical protein